MVDERDINSELYEMDIAEWKQERTELTSMGKAECKEEFYSVSLDSSDTLAGELYKGVIPQSKISKHKLAGREFVEIAFRRRRRCQSKKIAGMAKIQGSCVSSLLRARLHVASSIYSIYCSMKSPRHRHTIYSMSKAPPKWTHIFGDSRNCSLRNSTVHDRILVKCFQLIDDEEAKESAIHTTHGESKSSRNSEKEVWPKFSSFDTAAKELAGTEKYSLVRVTRSTTRDSEGSTVLKLETAEPGDLSLIDDEDLMDELFPNIGVRGESPDSVFIKKVVARPRYKSGMKIYIIPDALSVALYTDERMFERDLFKGVIDIETKEFYRSVFCTFDFEHIISKFLKELALERDVRSDSFAPVEPPMHHADPQASLNGHAIHLMKEEKWRPSNLAVAGPDSRKLYDEATQQNKIINLGQSSYPGVDVDISASNEAVQTHSHANHSSKKSLIFPNIIPRIYSNSLRGSLLHPIINYSYLNDLSIRERPKEFWGIRRALKPVTVPTSELAFILDPTSIDKSLVPKENDEDSTKKI